MSVPFSVAKIVAGFDSAHVEACLAEYDNLSATQKDAARGSVIEKVFPLAFGEDAVIEGSPKYGELKAIPW